MLLRRQRKGPANVCRELVSYLQQQASKPPEPPRPTASTAGPGQTAPLGDRPQQSSGQSAPVPSDQQRAPTPQISAQQAQSLAQSGDLKMCQQAVQQMRRAGVALPPGLLALAALREGLLDTMSP
jgi:hypothetical protein